MKNRNKYIVLVLLAFILVGCGNDKGNDVPTLSSQEKEIANEAVSHLINPEGSIEDGKDFTDVLSKAMDEFKEIELHEFDAMQTEFLQFTGRLVGEEILLAYLAGYEEDLQLTQWYETFSDSNVEFVMIMRLEDSESIAFRGNYFTEQGQFNFERMYGEIDMINLIG